MLQALSNVAVLLVALLLAGCVVVIASHADELAAELERQQDGVTPEEDRLLTRYDTT